MSDFAQYAYESGSDLDVTDRKFFCGLFVTESNNSTAHITVRDGGSAGAVVFDLNLSAYQNADITPATTVHFPSGIYVKVESGNVNITVLTC